MNQIRLRLWSIDKLLWLLADSSRCLIWSYRWGGNSWLLLLVNNIGFACRLLGLSVVDGSLFLGFMRFLICGSVDSSSIALLSLIWPVALHLENLWRDHYRAATNLIIVLMGWIRHTWPCWLVAGFRRGHRKLGSCVRRTVFSFICAICSWSFSRGTFWCCNLTHFALHRRLLLLGLTYVMGWIFSGRPWGAINPPCQARIFATIHGHFPTLKLIEQLVIGAIGSLLIVHCICSHNLFQIFLLLDLRLLFLSQIVLPC